MAEIRDSWHDSGRTPDLVWDARRFWQARERHAIVTTVAIAMHRTCNPPPSPPPPPPPPATAASSLVAAGGEVYCTMLLKPAVTCYVQLHAHTHTRPPPLLDDDDGDDEEHIITDITDVFTEEIYIYMPFKPLHQYVLQGYGRYGLS